MENVNEYLVIEKKATDGEDKTYVQDEKNRWIPFGKISWAAIFAGVLVTTVTQILLSLLGLGVGLGAFDPMSEQNPVEGLGVGTIVWWSVSMLVALFVGGLTTGKMYQTRSKVYLTWHGLLTWCAFTVLSFFILTTSVGKLVSGMGNIIGSAITVGATASQNSQLNISEITRDARDFFMAAPQPATPQGATADPNVSGTVQPGTTAANNQTLIDEVQAFFRGENVNDAEAREALINSMVTRTDMSRAEATERVDRWIGSYENIRESARVNADKAAEALSTVSIIGFFALVIGALVTIWGARMASPKSASRVNNLEKRTAVNY